MSTVVIHNRPSLLSRMAWTAALSIGGYFLARVLGLDPFILLAWDAVREAVPAFLDGLQTMTDIVRSAASHWGARK
ncbi:MAG TPA: hypothetical protein VF885_08605 [Arthrobacter sp.]